MTAHKYDTKQAAWRQFADKQIFIGDLADDGVRKSMGAGFASLHPGDVMEWVPSYEEFIVVLSGTFTVDFEGGSVTAGPHEMVWVEKGDLVTFRADGERVLLAFGTNPPWQSTPETQASAHMFRPLSGSPVD
jgi:ethanolamine utilization protein EutQ (cupin superfamily)